MIMIIIIIIHERVSDCFPIQNNKFGSCFLFGVFFFVHLRGN